MICSMPRPIKARSSAIAVESIANGNVDFEAVLSGAEEHGAFQRCYVKRIDNLEIELLLCGRRRSRGRSSWCFGKV